MRCVYRVLVLFLGLQLTAPAFGQQDAERWQELDSRVIEAYQQGRYADGAILAEQAYELARQAFGERHPDTIDSLDNLAGLYLRQGRYGEAEPLFEQALQLRREVLGESHPHTLESLANGDEAARHESAPARGLGIFNAGVLLLGS